MVFLTSLGKSIIRISCFDNILIIISFVGTNLSRAPDKTSHIHMRERKEKVLASLRDKMSWEFPMSKLQWGLNYWSWFSITYGTYFLNSETCLILRACLNNCGKHLTCIYLPHWKSWLQLELLTAKYFWEHCGFSCMIKCRDWILKGSADFYQRLTRGRARFKHGGNVGAP